MRGLNEEQDKERRARLQRLLVRYDVKGDKAIPLGKAESQAMVWLRAHLEQNKTWPELARELGASADYMRHRVSQLVRRRLTGAQIKPKRSLTAAKCDRFRRFVEKLLSPGPAMQARYPDEVSWCRRLAAAPVAWDTLAEDTGLSVRSVRSRLEIFVRRMRAASRGLVLTASGRSSTRNAKARQHYLSCLEQRGGFSSAELLTLELMRRHAMDGLDWKQVSQEAGLDVGVVRNRVYRLIKRVNRRQAAARLPHYEVRNTQRAA